MTDEEYKKLDHIAEATIRDDIMDTNTEIEDYETELQILKKRPQGNRVSICMIEVEISSRKAFVENLESILEYRIRIS